VTLGSAIRRRVLRYSVDLSEPNSWRLLDAVPGIALRVTIGTAEIAAEVLLRWRCGVAPKAFFVRPVDAERRLWITAPVEIGGGLLRVELQLERAPEHAVARMGEW
jgi:hypothetical protein